MKNEIEKLKLQYFSKLHKKWVDFKEADCEKSLKKYLYKIRINPKYDAKGNQ
jgi:hypothetical protein